MQCLARLVAVAALLAVGVIAQAADRPARLADQGRSAYRIVAPGDASPATRHAAEELQTFLQQITGAKLPIVDDKQPAVEHEIVLGRTNARLAGIEPKIDFASLGREGYVIRTVGSKLVIAGGEPRGTLYGVYGLLEDHWGCRWFAPGVSRIPRVKQLALPTLDERKVPVLEYREPFTFDCFDGDWCARNRVNSSTGRLEAKHGGKIRFAEGFFCHTFNNLVPPQRYFDKHPEYFALVQGKRLKDVTQLCCTNEDVIRICTEGVLAGMKAQPDATVFSVSQNDWDHHCECDKCQALAKAEDSQMAPVLHLVNRVAEAAEKQFPDKAVETLAYQWTRRPPKTTRPRPNVVIRLCSIECCFSHSLAKCDCSANQAFRRDIVGWSKLSNRLWVWDYTTVFSNYLLPFPNQRVRNDNIRFFTQHNVKGIFEQDTYESPHSEMASLGGYMTAKFLWNPDYDENTAMNEFLEGYYGPAAQPIRRYLDMIHDFAEQKNIHVTIYVPAVHAHLPADLLLKADKLWAQAETAAAGDPETLRRVKLSRMSPDYAIVEKGRVESGKGKAGDQEIIALAKQRFAPFMETLKSSGLTNLREGQRLNAEEYGSQLGRQLGVAK